MAEKKKTTQAKKNTPAKKSGKSTSAKAKTNDKNLKNARKPAVEQTTKLPGRWIAALVCVVLFVLMLTIFLRPEEGLLIPTLRGFFYGLMGSVAFYVSIPALIYLFVILAFSGKKPVLMRSLCLIGFVLICGCFHQLVLNSNLPSGFAVVSALFEGGKDGATAGLLCGGLALLLRLVIGSILTWIVLIVAALICFLAALNITIPSIIRAIQNRPRGYWEDEPQEEKEEPAAVVVNHIANKHIEHVEAKRQRQLEREEQMTIDEIPGPRKKSVSKSEEFMREVETDVSTPVAAAEQPVVPEENVDIILEKKTVRTPQQPAAPVPPVMPQLDMDEPLDDAPVLLEKEDKIPTTEVTPAPAPEVKVEKVTAKEAQESAAQVAAEIAQNQAQPKPSYCFPPIDLLTSPSRAAMDGTSEMRENTRRLNETLASFKIEAHIINVTRGPSVTRYEVELDKGVRLNKLTTCADDIALSLGASGVRIAAVPGKISVVGIEVPNKAVTTVSLREVIDSSEFSKAKSKSSFSVGKDIGGNCIVGNIAKLPHMLIAGTTGSGKSVCMNSVIISLLYKASPDDVKLIMVDPKMVELGIYNGIPHLLIPVVTDPKKAAGSLQWAVTEMMRRYKAMSDAGVRDLESFNSIVEAEGEGTKLPQIVVIIDELADLMLVAAKEVEESICRIAQMGRAAGIHLIIATQRPSADVITGLMKANIPSRIAFAVSSAMESRIILDTQGAEKLVGRGDMLYAPIGAGKPLRVQGCFVSDAEVEAVASYVKDNFNVVYDQAVLEEIEKKAAQTGNPKAAATAADPEPNSAEMDGDEMLPAAVDVILETGQASVSMLQRRLKLGYARAARIVDEMEEKGIVGPFQGSKPRTILITKEQWEVMKGGGPAQMTIDDLPTDGDIEDME